MPVERIRNIAIVAHVDHGKTTLIDQMLRQSETLGEREQLPERALDSNPLERERGITILAKNTAILWNGFRINVVDTPGHADFGGEVERILSMVDSVLLLVDAFDGPMPQTRFVTEKALARGFRPIVVINKIDRPGARPEWVLNATFELFDRLGANEAQLDFPVLYCSALHGYAGTDPTIREGDLTPLFDAILTHVPPPSADPKGPLAFQVSALDHSSYLGLIGIGRVQSGSLERGQHVLLIGRDGQETQGRVSELLSFTGLKRHPVERAEAGDIAAVAGLEALEIGATLCDPQRPLRLPPIAVEEPTVVVDFLVNDSPFAGREGKFLTSRQLRDRLFREARYNVALRVEETEDPNRFRVAGRGELHLGVLIETMRREGYELAVSRPEVILRESEEGRLEPWENVVLDLEEMHQGAVMERLGARRAELIDLRPGTAGRVRLEYRCPARGLIGFQAEFRTLTAGSGLMFRSFERYARFVGALPRRPNGVLIANAGGVAPAYALFHLQERGRLFIGPGETIYEGQIIGLHSRENDLTVNALRAKQLTNFRAAGKDDNLLLTPPLRMSLEQALEFIEDDELVEVTPRAIRLRKRLLSESARRQAARRAGAA
ncbi:MAG: GTP-binding elongation factor protein [Lysobacterales bacterium]|jgi:GTP-binding protein|nr:MAG: GTP-binding elongation factor protein [Xanthomonadales bacterium]